MKYIWRGFLVVIIAAVTMVLFWPIAPGDQQRTNRHPRNILANAIVHNLGICNAEYIDGIYTQEQLNRALFLRGVCLDAVDFINVPDRYATRAAVGQRAWLDYHTGDFQAAATAFEWVADSWPETSVDYVPRIERQRHFNELAMRAWVRAGNTDRVLALLTEDLAAIESRVNREALEADALDDEWDIDYALEWERLVQVSDVAEMLTPNYPELALILANDALEDATIDWVREELEYRRLLAEIAIGHDIVGVETPGVRLAQLSSFSPPNVYDFNTQTLFISHHLEVTARLLDGIGRCADAEMNLRADLAQTPDISSLGNPRHLLFDQWQIAWHRCEVSALLGEPGAACQLAETIFENRREMGGAGSWGQGFPVQFPATPETLSCFAGEAN